MVRLILLVFCSALIAGSAGAAQVIVNEYNAVDKTEFLQGGNEDPYLGSRLENGGDWVELVVIQDHLDAIDSVRRRYLTQLNLLAKRSPRWDILPYLQ